MSVEIRVAGEADEAAVNACLAASYATMAPRYDPAVFAVILPVITRISRAVLTGGTYHVASLHGAVVGVGGWTFERPGAPGEPPDPLQTHLRYVATHPEAFGKGVGRVLVDCCLDGARRAGAERIDAYATPGAEAFYRALGFEEVGPHPVTIGGTVAPSTHFTCRLRSAGGPARPRRGRG